MYIYIYLYIILITGNLKQELTTAVRTHLSITST